MLPNKQALDYGLETEIVNAKAYLYASQNQKGQNLYAFMVQIFEFLNSFISFIEDCIFKIIS